MLWKTEVRSTSKCGERGISSLQTSLSAITVFIDFEHRNRKLVRVVFAHHLLQYFNDLTERWLSGLFNTQAPVRLSQNRCDKYSEVQGKLLPQFEGKRAQIRPVKPFSPAEAVAAQRPIEHHIPKLRVSPGSLYAFYQFFERYGVKISSEEVV